ncbi:hypothetical protein RI844_12335 [Thalassotalea fonticola]|uniref:Glycosyl hydrolases family 39 N-terminal catalytic domain-containing protein n=1 Tax=Thalassotalea fonticola TaxID=3065649 RepID=A0ABZ0GKR5_9GAMM|nr:hypothetical protein RI844_12335 [Colwelliaceae bacterium S1-1]
MTSVSNKEINIDGESTKFDRYFQSSIGSCHAYLTLREDFRKHVRTVQQQIGFNSLRCHGIFHDWVGVYKEVEGKPAYNFQNVNKIYDFFLEQGLRPYVELSFMPSALASDESTIFHYQANISPPKDLTLWSDMITAFVSHLINRYGEEEVRQWYFEVWNEPDLKDLFWSGSQADYFELYRHTVTAIKTIDPSLKVGGPSTSKNLWIKEIIDFCEENNLPIDFISTHHYCADAALETDANVFNLEYRGQKAMLSDVLETVRLVRNSTFSKAEIHYSEWNVSPCHEDRYGKDSEFTAAFLLQTLKDLSGVVDSYSFWCLSDIFEETGPGNSPYSGKYGLVNMHGIKKAAFHAYEFLAKLYDNVLPGTGDSNWVTRSKSGNIRVLSWNFNEPISVDFNGADYVLDEQDKEESFALTQVSGQYKIKGYRVDKLVGNSYRSWQAMDSPEYLSTKQVNELIESSEPALFLEQTVECDGELTLKHLLTPCAIVFYDIEKLN